MSTRNGFPNYRARRRALVSLASVIALLALGLFGGASAFAKDGGGGGRQEIRVNGVCGRGATSKLQVKARDGALEVEFEVEHTRARAKWSVSLVREGAVQWRGNARTSSRRSFSIERRMSDLPGPDQIMARAVSSSGITCQANAVLPG
jgi:hypothetical protein